MAQEEKAQERGIELLPPSSPSPPPPPSPSSFQFTISQLQGLIDPKDHEQLKALGGVEKVAEGLKADLKRGLVPVLEEGEAFGSRKSAFGRNVLPHKPPTSFLSLIWEALTDKTLIILMIAALISIAVGIYEDLSQKDQEVAGDQEANDLGSWVEGVSILVTVAIIVLINAGNDFQKDKQFRKLNARKEDREVQVVRNGENAQVSIFELVVGDVVYLSTGEVIPADGLLIEGHNLKCDESKMTGESDSIKKNCETDPFLLSGTVVTEGIGHMLVISVGPYSLNGKTLLSLQTDPEDTPLQKKLEGLADTIGKLGLGSAILMFVILIIKYFVEKAVTQTTLPKGSDLAQVIIQFVISAVTLVVVAVPEGLPMAVTLALAFATLQMLHDKNLVRVLAACETMGGATTICSDKTGTLTQNKMTVVKALVAKQPFQTEAEIQQSIKALPAEILELVSQGISLNSTAYEGKDAEGRKVFNGSKTEAAMLQFISLLGVDYAHLREEFKIEVLLPFSSDRKRMSSVIKLKDRYRLYCKGASEIVLHLCTLQQLPSEQVAPPLTDEGRVAVEEEISSFASQGLRTIALAYRDLFISAEELALLNKEGSLETSLTFLGLLGIQDPLRPEVPRAIEQCKNAGIFVRMVTGDNVATAKNIAKSCGILTKGGLVLEGIQFRKMNKEQMERVIPNLQVLARSSPLDKQLLVERLKGLGETVAVTGDGTNDAPALKLADVGFSMGLTGTEIAKEASDIILMDDNFASIVKAVIWGRSVYDSVRKFLQFQLTVNIAAVILTFISSIADGQGESVLTAVQLLWVNLIMDTMAALALATEPPSEELLNRKPHGKTSPLISFEMWKMIIGQASFQVAVNLILLYLASKIFLLDLETSSGRMVNRTIVFNTFIFMQVFNELNARKINDSLNIFSKLHKHKLFLIIFLITVGVQVIITQYGGPVFKTTALNAAQWGFCIGVSAAALPIGFAIRLIPNCFPSTEHHTKPGITKEKFLWEKAINQVQIQLRVVKSFKNSKM